MKRFAFSSILMLGCALFTLATLPAHAEDGKASPAMEQKMDMKDKMKHGPMMDTNKDGFVTKEEMMDMHKKHVDRLFEKADKDKDGKLSKEEWKEGKKAMRAEMKDRKEDMRKMKDDMRKKMEDMKESGDMDMPAAE